jgi:hypothetical protein
LFCFFLFALNGHKLSETRCLSSLIPIQHRSRKKHFNIFNYRCIILYRHFPAKKTVKTTLFFTEISGNLTVCYWKWLINSWFTSSRWWFSSSQTVNVYQRVNPVPERPRALSHRNWCWTTATDVF